MNNFILDKFKAENSEFCSDVEKFKKEFILASKIMTNDTVQRFSQKNRTYHMVDKNLEEKLLNLASDFTKMIYKKYKVKNTYTSIEKNNNEEFAVYLKFEGLFQLSVLMYNDRKLPVMYTISNEQFKINNHSIKYNNIKHPKLGYLKYKGIVHPVFDYSYNKKGNLSDIHRKYETLCLYSEKKNRKVELAFYLDLKKQKIDLDVILSNIDSYDIYTEIRNELKQEFEINFSIVIEYLAGTHTQSFSNVLYKLEQQSERAFTDFVFSIGVKKMLKLKDDDIITIKMNNLQKKHKFYKKLREEELLKGILNKTTFKIKQQNCIHKLFSR